MALDKDLDLLDDYLANRLDEPGRKAFEQKLNGNPELRSEMELQQQMISSIKNARIHELKGMLNNIPVPAVQTSGATAAAKVATWVVVLGLIGAGLYLYLDRDTATTETKQTESTETKSDSQSQEEVVHPNTTTPAQAEDDSKDEAPVVSSEPSSAGQKPVAPKPASKDNVKKPDLEVYDPTTEQEQESSTEEIPAIGHERETPSISVEVGPASGKNALHYQFKEGKLFLYGPFQKDLYEIMEFFSDDKRTIFLYYNNEFYLLKDNSTTIKPLAPVQDQELVRKLKEYRSK